ncbi:ABC transporter substrate-binding protein [Clostridium grantii]|uniref:Branched-chain amino acid transport system substrate-binding protein n=1 Tax=Clostridium grantii DSM 8605 TaxID=1121316 RepID=A0A1M5XR97_9CLOT|nr:ABC transporter substrate-binding protein [Clostridium grantii]SHI02320.1 branched-chain amino acid transport system substrate-binding protein [Clostridium grantii DSM 8605]
MNKRKILSIFVSTALLVSILTGCGNKNVETVATSDETITLGAVLSLTGDLASIGQTAKNGIELAVEEVNTAGGVLGKQIKVVYEDDENKPAMSSSAIQKLINNNQVIGVIGPLTSPCSIAAGPVATENKIPMISPYATNAKVTSAGGEYVFRACFIDPFQGVVISKFAIDELEAKTAAVFYNITNDYAKGLAEVFIDEFAKAGGEIVGVETFNEGDQDFNAQLTNIKAMDADVLFLPNMYNNVGLIAKQAKSLGIDSILLGGDGWDSPDLFAIGGSDIDGGYFSTHFSPDDKKEIVSTYVETYKSKYGAIPDVCSTLSYDATKIMIKAIEEAGSTDTEKIKDAIQSLQISAVTGDITYDENRNPVKSAVIMKTVDGKQEFLKTIEP